MTKEQLEQAIKSFYKIIGNGHGLSATEMAEAKDWYTMGYETALKEGEGEADMEEPKPISYWEAEARRQYKDAQENFAAAHELAAEVERLKESDRQWISVKDQLPEEGGRYWCYVRELTDLGWSYFQWNCAYNAKERRFSDSTLTNGENVTHWQPLPEPPKPSGHE